MASWELLQKRGNDHFIAGNFEEAITVYTDAIEVKRNIAPMELADLFSNRAAAYLGYERPAEALLDCESALVLKPGHLKATFRMAKSFAKLGKYEKARDVLEKFPHTTTPAFQTEVSRLNRLLREQQNGKFDLKSLLKEAAVSKTPRLDHADYNGGVKMQWISEQRGKGLVAQRDFAPGDLLFVSKAFEAVYKSECNAERGLNASEMGLGCPRSECVSRIVRRIAKNKELAKADIDEACCLIDPQRVEAIVYQNSLGSSELKSKLGEFVHQRTGAAGTGFAFDGCGIWILASFMNHSCAPNSVIFYVGDLMFVRAAKRIRNGEELTTSYTYLGHDYKKRQAALEEKYGLKCGCELCLCDLKRAVDDQHLDAVSSHLKGGKPIFADVDLICQISN